LCAVAALMLTLRSSTLFPSGASGPSCAGDAVGTNEDKRRLVHYAGVLLSPSRGSSVATPQVTRCCDPDSSVNSHVVHQRADVKELDGISCMPWPRCMCALVCLYCVH
jgi:hypothetical protein